MGQYRARLAIIFDVKHIDILTYEDGWFAFDTLLFPKRQLNSLIWLALELGSK